MLLSDQSLQPILKKKKKADFLHIRKILYPFNGAYNPSKAKGRQNHDNHYNNHHIKGWNTNTFIQPLGHGDE